MQVIAHADLFPRGAEDEVWIAEVSRRGLVILTTDRRIVRVSAEYAALLRSNARQFVLTEGELTAEQIAATFLRARKAMERRVRTLRAPFVLSVSGTGLVARRAPRTREGLGVAKGLRPRRWVRGQK